MPASIDFEVFDDVLRDLRISIPRIEHEISGLGDTLDDAESLHHVCRSVLTLKRNFIFCGAEELSMFFSAMEEALEAMQSGAFQCSEVIAEALLQGFDCAKEMAAQVSARSPIDEGSVTPIAPLLQRLGSAADQASAEAIAEDVICVAAERFQVSASHRHCVDSSLQLPPGARILLDSRHLRSFRKLAHAQDARNPYWTDRSTIQIQLVLAINQCLQQPVDDEQLLVALCWHDMGMMLLPDRILLKQLSLDVDEMQQLCQHVSISSELLGLFPQWQDAATMVLHHHERVDGSGYPAGLSGDAIHPGAQLIALADSYYAMTRQRADRNHKRSLLRALIEVNACVGKQFDAIYVAAFNGVVREMIAQ